MQAAVSGLRTSHIGHRWTGQVGGIECVRGADLTEAFQLAIAGYALTLVSAKKKQETLETYFSLDNTIGSASLYASFVTRHGAVGAVS